MTGAKPRPDAAFDFQRDSFAFPHELVWQYSFHPVTGAMSVARNDPPPTYYHRCFVIVRSTRQFFWHARFEPGKPAVEPENYRRLIRRIVARSPRQACAESDRIVFPGFDGLRSFSRAHEALLKTELGGPWQSYFLRTHWRMIFPKPGLHQKRTALRLERSLRAGGLPLVHLFRFPVITINHGIVLYGVESTERELHFEAYDPNIPAHPVILTYDRARRRFSFPPCCYWPGGDLSVMEIFRRGLL